jgi:hypothetical protein
MELIGHADLRMLLPYSHVVSGETQAAGGEHKNRLRELAVLYGRA